ncbi:MAG: hypothetical protein IH881_06750 [Myxococcales bacterium]|nr:hypothetical protein [Myxococcales bacterium]
MSQPEESHLDGSHAPDLRPQKAAGTQLQTDREEQQIDAIFAEDGEQLAAVQAQGVKDEAPRKESD